MTSLDETVPDPSPTTDKTDYDNKNKKCVQEPTTTPMTLITKLKFMKNP